MRAEQSRAEQSRAEQSRAEQSRAEQRIASIDILKGIGIISVVIGHAMNTDNYYSNSVELTRRFVYLYHLAIFFFCSGYLIRVRYVKYIILKFLKQYKMFLLICFSSFILLPLWVKTGTVTWSGYHEIVVKVKNILFFRQDGYFDGAMWFVPFMAVTSFIYSVLLLIKQRNIKVYYLFVMICAVMGMYLVMKKGVGGYYKWLALLMIPIMAAGNEYRKFESKIVEKGIPLILVGAVMLFLCKQGEIELSKGMIFGFLFYPITLLGILFCIKLKDYIMRTKKLSNWLVWVGSNSMYVMGYHFIVFKLIDIIMSVFTVTTPEQLKLFPYSFPQCSALYIVIPHFIYIQIMLYSAELKRGTA